MAFDAFLKIDGIPGESTDDKHKDWIDVLAFSWGMSQPATATRGGGGAERVQVMNLSFNHLLDKASPKLFLACASGSHIKEATLELRYAGKSELGSFYQLKLSDVIVSSVKESGTAQGSETPAQEAPMAAVLPQPKPPEDVALNFGKIEWTYRPLDAEGKPSGAISGYLDLRTNRTG